MQIQTMTESHIPAVSEVRLRGWRWAYAGIVPQDYLDGMSAEADTEQRQSWFSASRGRVFDFVATDNAQNIVGWVSTGRFRGVPADNSVGEVYALYLAPDVVGTGVGRALLSKAELCAAANGFTAMKLWVLKENSRARCFYERSGYSHDGAVQVDSYGEAHLPEVRYERKLPLLEPS